jgi:hypothetical protein
VNKRDLVKIPLINERELIMKVVMFNGSPRRKGNTGILLKDP